MVFVGGGGGGGGRGFVVAACGIDGLGWSGVGGFGYVRAQHAQGMVAFPDLDGPAWLENTEVFVHEELLHRGGGGEGHVLYHDEVKFFFSEGKGVPSEV